jgi:hypothetical protein
MTKKELEESKRAGFLEEFYRVYLNRYSYYEVPKQEMPKVLKFLEENAYSFKHGEGGEKRLLGVHAKLT